MALRIADALTRHASERRNEIAMEDGTTRLSWGEVSARAQAIANGPLPPEDLIGLHGENGCEWAIAYLALLMAGKTIVPLPQIFSAGQIAHIVRATRIKTVITVSPDGGSLLPAGLRAIELSALTSSAGGATAANRQNDAVVVFTSGSTGEPKGVRLTLGNLLATAEALIDVAGITAADSYFSVLPLATLLEQICAIIVPVLVGARVLFDPATPRDLASGAVPPIAQRVYEARPTMLVLVPQLLRALVGQIRVQPELLPRSLRFIAVGGAKAGEPLIAAARNCGLPVYEGYGLTECGSVVALATPACKSPGSVGRPLPGISVEIVDGEIVVTGGSVMAGYLGARDLDPHRWHTGDLGELMPDGSLIVHGRKDALIVCANGRNVSPEWVETALEAVPGVLGAIVCPTADHSALSAILTVNWPASAQAAQIESVRARILERLPRYAAPETYLAISPEECRAAGLTRLGKPDRVRARTYLQDHSSP